MLKNFPVEKLSYPPTVIWEATPLFNVSDGCKLIELCELYEVAVLGIEGFRVVDGFRIPDIDYVVDFSGLLSKGADGFPNHSRNLALNFIRNSIPDDIFIEFELVCICPDIPPDCSNN